MSRPRTCYCDECPKCRKRAYQARWWASLTDEQRAEKVAARDREKVRAVERALRVGDPDYPRKKRAHSAVERALRSGRLKRGACEQLGPDCKGRIEGHHDDYDRQLDVRWLCRFHHDRVEEALRWPSSAS